VALAFSSAASSSQQDSDTLQGKKGAYSLFRLLQVAQALNARAHPGRPLTLKRCAVHRPRILSPRQSLPRVVRRCLTSFSQGTGVNDGVCDSCLPELRKRSYLLEVEEIYEPPEDPDSKLSLEELGLSALERIPRNRALDGIRAFNTMRDDLKNFLRPFAQEGKSPRWMSVDSLKSGQRLRE